MAKSEPRFIDLCKKQLEQKFNFGNGDGYSQRDLELLSTHIEEKTGVLISLWKMERGKLRLRMILSDKHPPS